MTTTGSSHQIPSDAPVFREVAGILARPYARLLERGPEGWYTATVLEFPGTAAEGKTPDEAMARLDEALTAVVEVMLEYGDPIPDPLATTEHSGRLRPDIPPSLHAEAARLAAVEGISLDRFLLDAIARHVGAVTARLEKKDRG